jgi:hypothetical protein
VPIPKLVVTAALMVAQVAIGAMRKFEGPRLDNTGVSLADFGTAIVRFWGRKRQDGPPIIWAENLREKKVTNKTKGGKYTEYRYYGTWANLITDRPIDAVSKIWMDKHLVYDATTYGPMTIILGILGGLNGPVKLQRGKNMRLYLGTEDQMPDPRMEAWCEDRYGANSCPAYRGSSYVVFEELPLEKFGNRIPQMAIEAVSEKTPAYLYEQFSSSPMSSGADFAIGGEWMVYSAGSSPLQWWHLPTRENMGLSGQGQTTMFNVAVANDGTAYFNGAEFVGVDVHFFLYITPPLGVTTKVPFTENPDASRGTTRVFDIGTDRHIFHGSPLNGYVNYVSFVAADESHRDFCLRSDDTVWAVTQPDGASDQFSIRELVDENGMTGSSYPLTAPDARADISTAKICHVAEYGHFFVVMDGNWITVDDTTHTVTDSGAAAWDANTELPWNDPYRTTFWDGLTEYSLEDGSEVRSFSSSSWVSGSVVGPGIYDPVNHANISRTSVGNLLTFRYFDRIGSAGVLLQHIVEDVAEWCGVTVDAVDLDQTVAGYSVVQGTGKDMLAPLLDIHDSDARPHDFTAQFIKRGNSSVATIETADFVREGDETRYTVSITQDTDLPAYVSFTYLDSGRDQQTNSVDSKRAPGAVDSQRAQTLDGSTYVSTPAEAKPLVDRYFRRVWNERESIACGFTMQQAKLEPADVVTLDLDGIERTARITKTTFSAGRIQAELVRDFPGLNLLGGAVGAEMEGRDNDVIPQFPPTKGFVLDTNLAEDADNSLNPLLYYGAGPYGDNFAGAVIYQADEEDFVPWNSIDSSTPSAWGYATDELADHNPWLWDRGNSVNVKTFGGTLSTVTEAQINANPMLNRAYIAGEQLNFTTATLESDGTYTLSGFKRGRRGTERFTGTHAIGDEFVLMANMAVEELGLSDVGTEDIYKAVTVGRDPISATAIPVDFDGNSLKPYAPVIWHVTKDEGTGDITIEIRTRTRIGGAWNGSAISTGEASEEYEFDVLDGDDVVRTLESADKTFEYTAANQTTDFGSEIEAADLEGFAYQLSATVGRGFAEAA